MTYCQTTSASTAHTMRIVLLTVSRVGRPDEHLSPDRLYCFGGSTGTTLRDDLWVLEDPRGVSSIRAWRELPAGPAARVRLGLAEGAGKLFVVFGFRPVSAACDSVLACRGDRRDDVWSFDLESEEWADLSPTVGGPLLDWAPGTLMANAGGRLYVVELGRTYLLSLDPAAPPWAAKRVEVDVAPTGPKKRAWMHGPSGLFVDGPPARVSPARAALDGKVWLHGGILTSSGARPPPHQPPPHPRRGGRTAPHGSMEKALPGS